jgi:DNA-binding transcriptional LysR family regulator
MSKLDDLNAWRLFVSLCKTKNFTDTAAEFDLEVSSVSRAVAALEKNLGQELISRTVRPFQLTKSGLIAEEYAENLLRIHHEMITELQSRNTELEGRIRLSLAQGFVERFLMPLLMEFNSIYPDVSFDVVGGGSLLDVLHCRADIAVVSSHSSDPRLMSFSRGRNVYVPVASPAYIEKFGMPLHPSDLARHRLLAYSGSVRDSTKELTNGKECEKVLWDKVVRVGNILAIKRSVLDGLGVSVDMPLLHCADEIAAGTLVPILPGWYKPPVECFIVTTKANWHVRRHRLFVEWLQKKLQAFFAAKEDLVRPYWTAPLKTVVNEA